MSFTLKIAQFEFFGFGGMKGRPFLLWLQRYLLVTLQAALGLRFSPTNPGIAW